MLAYPQTNEQNKTRSSVLSVVYSQKIKSKIKLKKRLHHKIEQIDILHHTQLFRCKSIKSAHTSARRKKNFFSNNFFIFIFPVWYFFWLTTSSLNECENELHSTSSGKNKTFSSFSTTNQIRWWISDFIRQKA